ncbi:MAG: TIGR02186 family protein [Rhabdaerophilum sp.]
MSRAQHVLRAVLFLGLLALPHFGAAQEMVVTLSTREVAITSNFTGAEITAFGLIERDVRMATRAAPFDVVATVQGPAGEMMLHQKGKFGPIWLTAGRKRFSNVPLHFALLSAKPLAEIADSDTAARLKLGLEHYLTLPPATSTEQAQEDASFREAMLRLRASEGSSIIDASAITMIRPNLFTAKVQLPGKAPTGLYLINISVLSEGVVLRTVQSGFVVRKVGIDGLLASAARNQPGYYAFATILMAIALGWLANVVFRRD